MCEKALSTLKVELVWVLPALESSDCAERSALRAPDRPRCTWKKAGKFRKIGVMRRDQSNSSSERNSPTRAAAESRQARPTLRDPRDSAHQAPRPQDSPGQNTGVGCHFLLQCVKVKSEREVSQSCRTLSDPMDCSLPGSSIHGIFQARVLEWGCHCLLP